MRAVFHIGRPKTGSTTLQVFLQDNRAALAAQGVLYERVDEGISSQWEFPIAALAERGALPPDPYVKRMLGIETVEDARAYSDRMLRAFEARMQAAGDGYHTWVASSEHVYPYMTKQVRIEAFDALMRRYFDDITYVVYLRRQEDLVLSAYSEAVRRGVTVSFDDFVAKFLDAGRGNHMSSLRKWLAVVGKDRLKVGLLERDALEGGDLVTDFCQLLGLPNEGFAQPQVHNPSLTQDALKAFLLINRSIASVETKSAWRQTLRSRLCATAEDWGRKSDPMAMPPELIDRIRTELGPSNERLRARFFPERAELFPARAAKGGGSPPAQTPELANTN